MDVVHDVKSVYQRGVKLVIATEQERLEQELAELRKLTRCKTLEKCPAPRWKVIRDETIEHKGEVFNRKLWVAVCGGAVEYTEGLVEGKRAYQVERFELKPASWVKEKVLAWPCSMIVSDTYDSQKEAMERVEFHKESITPFWWKVKGGEESKMEQLTMVTDEAEFIPTSSSNPKELGLSDFHQLMLHSMPHLYGSPGIVVNEAKAKAGPCRCVEYAPGKKLCFTPGIIGALSDPQEEIYCKEYEKMESPRLVERMESWQACVTKSREALPPTNGATRLELFLSSMSKCLTEAGIEA